MKITCDSCEVDFDDVNYQRYCPHNGILRVAPPDEDIDNCVHPYGKVYIDDTDGRIICSACDEVLVGLAPEEVSEWHKEGPNPPLLDEED